MRIAIEIVRSRVGQDRSITVYHTDLPANDFKSLFELLKTDPGRYSLDDLRVFPCAIGRSFYEGVLPPDYVHLGWCSYAAMWISQIPPVRPDHIMVPRMTGAVRAAFERQASLDWKNFLTLRALELRSGGRLVVVVPAAHDDGWCGFEAIMDHAYEVLAEMVAEGAIAAEERDRMALGVWPRRRSDLLAPFQLNGRFRGLAVECCEMKELADPGWADYERDRNREALVGKQAGFYRSAFAPTLASWLTRADDAEVRRMFADRLERGLRERLTDEPAPINSLVETIVFAK
jgi:SAM dependent carboxyl methyltransferase